MPPATHCSASSHGRRWETSPPTAALLPFRVPFFRSSTSFFISTLQAAPFQSIISSTPTPGSWRRRLGGRGGHAKRCGIYLSFLAPVAGFHKALWPFSFTPSCLIPLPPQPPSFFAFPSNWGMKKKGATLVFQANLSPFWPFCYFCSFHFYPCLSGQRNARQPGHEASAVKNETKAHVRVVGTVRDQTQ